MVEDIDGGIYILDHLEVEHAYAYEVGTIFKGPAKSVLGLECTGSKDFESHYRHFNTVNKFHRSFGEQAENVVVETVVLEVSFSIHFEGHAFFPRVG